MTNIYAPARPGLAIPMPDRGNRIMPEGGAAIDARNSYYRRLIADGDIVPVAGEAEDFQMRPEPIAEGAAKPANEA